MGRLALGTVSTDALMGKRGRTKGPGLEMRRKSLLGNALSESRAQAPCPAVLHPHTLPPQPHPCSSFALSSGDPILAIGSEFPPGRGSGRAKPECFPDRLCGRRRRDPQRDHLSRLFLQPAPVARTSPKDSG